MIARLCALLALVAATGCSGVGRLPPQSALCRISQQAELALHVERNFALVPASVDGHATQLLLDTGAAISTITPEAAAMWNLPHDIHGRLVAAIGGEVQSQVVRAPTLTLGDLVLRDRALSEGRVASLPDAVPPVSGVLGADVLDGHDLDLDVQERRVGIYTISACPDFRPWPQPDAVALARSDDGLLFAVVLVDGHAIRALLDTGARVSFMSRRLAASLGVTAQDLAGDQRANGIGFGDATTPLRIHRFTRLDLGGLDIAEPRISVVDQLLPGVEMLLGADVLGQREMWLSYPSARLYLR